MGGDGGSEGLGLGVAPHLTLVRLGHGHMRGLSATIADGMADVANVVANQLGGGGRHQGGDANESLWQKTLLISNTALPPLLPSPSSLWLYVGLMLSPGPRGLYSVRPKVHRRLDGLVGRRWFRPTRPLAPAPQQGVAAARGATTRPDLLSHLLCNVVQNIGHVTLPASFPCLPFICPGSRRDERILWYLLSDL